MRELIEEPYFTRACEKIFGAVRSADAELEMIRRELSVSDLSRYPIAQQTKCGAVQVIVTKDLPAFESVSVYFVVAPDGGSVVLHSIDIEPLPSRGVSPTTNP